MDYLSGWCHSQRRLDGLTAIITGSNTGIGKETATDFYHRGARVIMACRDTKKAEAAKTEIEATEVKIKIPEGPKGEVLVESLDLSSLKSVRDFASRILTREEKVNILVNNAGVMVCPEGRTEDGFETHIGTNHFGHALLTLLLLPRLTKCAPSRIVFVTSKIALFGTMDLNDINYEKSTYNPLRAYIRSKIANKIFARVLAKKLKEHNISNVTTYSVHPGIVKTDIGRHFNGFITAIYYTPLTKLWWKTPRCGAQTTIYCAVDEKCADQSGLYYSECSEGWTTPHCKNDRVAETLWDITVKGLNLTEYDPFGKEDPSPNVKNTNSNDD